MYVVTKGLLPMLLPTLCPGQRASSVRQRRKGCWMCSLTLALKYGNQVVQCALVSIASSSNPTIAASQRVTAILNTGKGQMHAPTYAAPRLPRHRQLPVLSKIQGHWGFIYERALHQTSLYLHQCSARWWSGMWQLRGNWILSIGQIRS